MHAEPAEPHWLSELPGTHFAPSQHPPWHSRPPAHEVEQSPVDGLQASPFGQLDVVHGVLGPSAALWSRSGPSTLGASGGPSTRKGPSPPLASRQPPTHAPASSREHPAVAPRRAAIAASAASAACHRGSASPLMPFIIARPQESCPLGPRPTILAPDAAPQAAPRTPAFEPAQAAARQGPPLQRGSAPVPPEARGKAARRASPGRSPVRLTAPTRRGKSARA
jgi:hypothetical protein